MRTNFFLRLQQRKLWFFLVILTSSTSCLLCWIRKKISAYELKHGCLGKEKVESLAKTLKTFTFAVLLVREETCWKSCRWNLSLLAPTSFWSDATPPLQTTWFVKLWAAPKSNTARSDRSLHQRCSAHDQEQGDNLLAFLQHLLSLKGVTGLTWIKETEQTQCGKKKLPSPGILDLGSSGALRITSLHCTHIRAKAGARGGRKGQLISRRWPFVLGASLCIVITIGLHNLCYLKKG